MMKLLPMSEKIELILKKNIPGLASANIYFFTYDEVDEKCTEIELIARDVCGEEHTKCFSAPFLTKDGLLVNYTHEIALVAEMVYFLATSIKAPERTMSHEEMKTAVDDWLSHPHQPIQFEEEVEAVKNDSGKLRMDLIAPEMLTSIAEVLTMGAEKYGDRNWELGLDADRLYAACMRHLVLWRSGQDLDDESGLHHVKHALVNLGMLCTFIEREEKDNE